MIKQYSNYKYIKSLMPLFGCWLLIFAGFFFWLLKYPPFFFFFFFFFISFGSLIQFLLCKYNIATKQFSTNQSATYLLLCLFNFTRTLKPPPRLYTDPLHPSSLTTPTPTHSITAHTYIAPPYNSNTIHTYIHNK